MLCLSRGKQWSGAAQAPEIALVTADTRFNLPDGAGGIILTGADSPTITTMSHAKRDRGCRVLWLYNNGAGTVTFQTSVASTTPESMDLGMVDVVLTPQDFIIFYLRKDGVWIRATTLASN